MKTNQKRSPMWKDVPVQQVYLKLYVSDPSLSDTQTLNEVTYTNYARISITRTRWEKLAALLNRLLSTLGVRMFQVFP